MRRHKTTLEIRKIIHLSRSSTKSIIHKLKKYFADRKKIYYKATVFRHGPLPNLCQKRTIF